MLFVAEIQKMGGLGKRIVFVSGNFNTLHPGHMRLLQFALICLGWLGFGLGSVWFGFGFGWLWLGF